MKAWVVAAIGGPMLFLGGGWYVGSPWITLYTMRAAIERRDVEALIGYVDFAALRQNLKDQVRATAPSAAVRTDAAGWTLPTPDTSRYALIEQQIDRYVTPETARTMLARAGGAARSGFDGPNRIGVGEMARDVAIDRPTLGTFVVRARNSPQGPGVVFTAHGLGWKLSGVTLPTGMTQFIGNRATGW